MLNSDITIEKIGQIVKVKRFIYGLSKSLIYIIDIQVDLFTNDIKHHCLNIV